MALIQVSDLPAASASDGAVAAELGTVDDVKHQRTAARGPVCVVDDDDWVCDSLSVLLETYGFAVQAYHSGLEFLGDERRDKAKCLIIDQHMPELDGLSVVAELHRQGIYPPSILITGRLDAGLGRRARQLGVAAILEKPFPVARLVESIEAALATPG